MTEDEKKELRRTDRRADGVPCDYSDLIDPPESCSNCGYLRLVMPRWVKFGAIFALYGRVYRVVTVGTTNRGVASGRHVRETVHAEVTTEAAWRLPNAPCLVVEVAAALADLQRLPTFYVEDLERAIHVEPAVQERDKTMS